MRLSLDERLKVAKLHINEDVSYAELAKTYKVDPGRVKYWVSMYQRWGEKAFKKDFQKVEFSRQLKIETIHEILSKKVSCRQKAIDLMITDPSTVSDWVKLFQKYGEEAIKDTHSREAYKKHDERVLETEYKKLLEDLERTKAENEYLKKSFPQVLERSKRSNKK